MRNKVPSPKQQRTQRLAQSLAGFQCWVRVLTMVYTRAYTRVDRLRVESGQGGRKSQEAPCGVRSGPSRSRRWLQFIAKHEGHGEFGSGARRSVSRGVGTTSGCGGRRVSGPRSINN